MAVVFANVIAALPNRLSHQYFVHCIIACVCVCAVLELFKRACNYFINTAAERIIARGAPLARDQRYVDIVGEVNQFTCVPHCVFTSVFICDSRQP